MPDISAKKRSDNCFDVFVGAVKIGEIYCELDGFYVFVFDNSGGGFFDSDTLKSIANRLETMNEPWRKDIDEYFENKQ